MSVFIEIRLKFRLIDVKIILIAGEFVWWRKMSKNYRAIQCHCADENYSESAGSDSDDALDTHESTAEMQKVDVQESLIDSIKSTSSLRYTTSRDPSEKSSAVEVLKKVDADRKSRISVQNLKLSLIFPKASLCLLM